MSSEIKYTCDFCGNSIVKACKTGSRGYCLTRGSSDSVAQWRIDPRSNINGPHICENCVNGLLDSDAFKQDGLY